MIVEAPPGAGQLDGIQVTAASGLPERLAGWSVTQVRAGLWLSDTAGEVPGDVLALPAEPGSLSLVVAAAGPDGRTDELVGALFPVLAGRTRDVRLVLSGASDRYAAAARDCGLNLVAPDDAVVITPHGFALVRPGRQPGPLGPGQLAQWRSYLASGEREPAGVLAPSPRWERELPSADVIMGGVTVRRVPAGLAMLADPEAGGVAEAALAAGAVWPDPDRITIVIGAGQRALLRDALAALLPRLPLRATDGVRLYWPRAGAGASRREIQELAWQCETDLIAPAADLAVSGFGAVCHGPAGAAPWVRLTSGGDVEFVGSLYPAPAWELGLADIDLDGLAGSVLVEHIAAGLCVYRPGFAERGLIATARSLLPDPDRLTVVIGGEAGDPNVRRDVEVVFERIANIAARGVRLLLARAGSGGRDSFGQLLADALNGEVLAPAGGWTATPDGRAIALPVAGTGSRDLPHERWQTFSSQSAGPVATSAEPDPAAALAEPTGSAAEPLPPPAEVPQDRPVDGDRGEGGGRAESVAVLPRDHRSSARDRQLYRESAARYHSHLVAVRRVLTQRPGLRAAAAGDAEDAVVTDFAAVLDFMADDRVAATAALRAGSAGRDPRVACVISGFRRLPSFTGAVFTSAFLGGAAPDIYVRGAFLLEPAFVLATSSHVVALEGDIDYAIWSQTGKRLAALAVDAARDEIVFPAGTVFRVLAIYTPAEIGERALAFLRESVRQPGEQAQAQAAHPGEPFDEMDRRVLERLAAAASMRSNVPPEDRTLSRPAASGPLLIGFDASGVPFRERADG